MRGCGVDIKQTLVAMSNNIQGSKMLVFTHRVEISPKACPFPSVHCYPSNIYVESADFESAIPPDPSIYKPIGGGFYLVASGGLLTSPVSFYYTKSGGQCEFHIASFNTICP